MHLDKLDFYLIIGTALLVYAAGAWKNKLPSTSAIQELVSLIDTKGGNIIILGALALYFFHRTEQMYYAVMALVNSNSIKADNGVALNGLLFCNGAFSGVSGALLKVMSGNGSLINGKSSNGITQVPPPPSPNSTPTQ